MSQQEDDLRALAKIMDFLRATSIVLVIINIYWFCPELHPSNPDGFFTVIDKVLNGFDRSCHLFRSQYTSKWFALLLLALSCFGTRGVKNEDITWRTIWIFLGIGVVLYFMPKFHYTLYIMCSAAGFICLLMAGNWMSRLLKNNLMNDVFNNENESFQQETRKIKNEYSINLPTRFYYKKKWNDGWINVVNPFRATIVLGTPGSGKSYAVVNNFLKQQIEKGFALYCYDFKFADLSTIVYNHFLKNKDKYPKGAKFYVINFDDLYAQGYRGLLFDIDNTLVPHGAPADERACALFAHLKELGFKCCFLSNNQYERVSSFNDAIGAQFIENAHKPSTKNYIRAMELLGTDRSNTVFIGDQLFTDIYGAKRTGIRNILVKPLNPKEEIQIVLKRYLERIVLYFYRKEEGNS